MRNLLVIILLSLSVQIGHAQPSDADRLGMAIEYFQSGKYHEALLLLQKLDKEYHLNPRFRAYLGVCYYYEWDFKNACKYLDMMLPELQVFSPAEQTVYYFTNAESHFNLQEYDKAIPLYERMLMLCRDNEKPEALYRLGFCYLFGRDWPNAYEYFNTSLASYLRFRNTPDQQARIEQIRNMINGCREKLPEDYFLAEDTLPADTLKANHQPADTLDIERLKASMDVILKTVGR